MAIVMEQHRVNGGIIAQTVVIIAPCGTNKGVISINEARIAAKTLGLDLVQVSGDQPIPIVKLTDYKKFKFDLQKKENHKKKSQAETKSIVFSCNCADGDVNTKLNHVRRILSEGDSVEISVKSDNARDPDARIRNLNLAFDVARKIHGIINQEKGVRTTPVVKQERAAKFFVNNSSKN